MRMLVVLDGIEGLNALDRAGENHRVLGVCKDDGYGPAQAGLKALGGIEK